MGVLVDPQVEQGGEDLSAEVAAVGQLLLVRPDVLQELVQLLEGLRAGLQHALVHLQRAVEGGVRLASRLSWCKSALCDVTKRHGSLISGHSSRALAPPSETLLFRQLNR